ncbi:MAG: ATP-binding protein [Gammaproteobacteria bacterium]|nr:ATP-binding protein [Gammaproteobacteria bacterium]MDH3905454.1 ATP-binding protein [Gammaproteobacteria bacterium]
MKDSFIDNVRNFAQVFVDRFDRLEADVTEQRIIELLDSAMLSGQGSYAAIEVGGRTVGSSLMNVQDAGLFREDFAFGEHDDDVYYLSLPVSGLAEPAVLKLGYDESPIHEDLVAVRLTLIYVLSAYLLLTLVVAGFMSATIVSPLRWLQTVSRAISSGDVDRELKPDSRLEEISALADDLERMRRNLVGINARLKEEIAERAQAEADRRQLEEQAHHHERLRSLGTLAGGVAHEFNNVLQPMVLYLELALEDLPADSPIAENLLRVQELARRAKGLSQQILTFSRHDSDPRFVTENLAPIAEEAVTMIRALLPATVDLRIDINPDCSPVKCAPEQIQQLLVNLCNNAHQALSDDAGYISVSLGEVQVSDQLASRHSQLDAGQYVLLEVQDTGMGMDPATQERIFEPFFTTHEVGKGTGLGLSVVHGIVERHDGEITVESKPGKGTRFNIFLPCDGRGEQSR